MSDPNALSPSHLVPLIGRPDAPVIVDICIPEDVAADPFTLPGALRGTHTDLPEIVAQVRGRRSVIVCQKGLKLSQGVAAWLRAEGHPAQFLEGGMYGWRDASAAMRVPLAAQPGTGLWVCEYRPDTGRLATCWLILRFVQPTARVLFVAGATIADVAQRFDATPVPSFNEFATTCGLHAPALAQVPTLASTCAPVFHGLAALHKEDTALLSAALPVMDALYRAAQRESRI